MATNVWVHDPGRVGVKVKLHLSVFHGACETRTYTESTTSPPFHMKRGRQELQSNQHARCTKGRMIPNAQG